MVQGLVTRWAAGDARSSHITRTLIKQSMHSMRIMHSIYTSYRRQAVRTKRPRIQFALHTKLAVICLMRTVSILLHVALHIALYTLCTIGSVQLCTNVRLWSPDAGRLHCPHQPQLITYDKVKDVSHFVMGNELRLVRAMKTGSAWTLSSYSWVRLNVTSEKKA
jgi:hypothetical protein